MPQYFDTSAEFGGYEPPAPQRVTLFGLLAEFVMALWVPFTRRVQDIDLLYFGRVDGRWCEGYAVEGEPHYFRDGYRVRA